jgi:UDP-N-acetylbacillosamine N-acetyltransferase
VSDRGGLLILGFGGHARSVADVALAAGHESLLFVDENARDGEHFLRFPVQRAFAGRIPDGWACIPASGDNERRKAQIELADSSGWPLATVVAPSATVGAGATVSRGCFLGHHAHIGPFSFIGTGCIINTGAVVEHECAIGDYTHIAVNATVAGRSKIGAFVFLGAGTTVIDGIAVGDHVTIGAGGVVVVPIEIPGTYVGVPVHRTATFLP